MPLALDAVSPDRLLQAAERVRLAHDVVLPSLTYLNTSPCLEHGLTSAEPVLGCVRCGMRPRRHQRTAATWLFLARKALLADQMGVGKSLSAMTTLAMAAQAGELDPARGGGRVLVVCRPPALDQWRQELCRALPGLVTEIADGSALSLIHI